jgi:hypothetical protein
MTSLLDLPENWDSYGARRIAQEAVAAAAELITQIARVDTPPPSITPTVRGGITLEWNTRGIGLEVRVEPPRPLHVFHEDLHAGTEDEFDLEAHDLSRLVDLVALLS